MLDITQITFPTTAVLVHHLLVRPSAPVAGLFDLSAWQCGAMAFFPASSQNFGSYWWIRRTRMDCWTCDMHVRRQYAALEFYMYGVPVGRNRGRDGERTGNYLKNNYSKQINVNSIQFSIAASASSGCLHCSSSVANGFVFIFDVFKRLSSTQILAFHSRQIEGALQAAAERRISAWNTSIYLLMWHFVCARHGVGVRVNKDNFLLCGRVLFFFRNSLN